MRGRPHGDGDPLEVPDYVAQSLRAWCAWDAARARAAPREYSTEREQLEGRDPTYDPTWDWLDEPFPEERQ